jgi:hypothetical protein
MSHNLMCMCLCLCLCVCRVGLDVLMRAGVAQCHTDVWEEKYASELGASTALFKTGYTIDCLLIRCVVSEVCPAEWNNTHASSLQCMS